MSMRNTLALVGLLATGMAVGGEAQAHHAWVWYGKADFSLTGTVVETHFGNPHDRITVKSDGQLWNVVLSPPRRTEKAGLVEKAIQVGDTITAFGERHQDPERLEMKAERLQIGDKTYDLYPERL
jgi:Family of unknown function (DUF6152)